MSSVNPLHARAAAAKSRGIESNAAEVSAARPMSRAADAPRRFRAPVTALSALVGVALMVLSGCAQDSGNNDDVLGQGYQSGDGSTRTWSVEERGESLTLTGPGYSGNPVGTSAWLGDVVVLNTWYAACPPCRAEAPDLLDIATERADDGVHVLGINRTDDAGAAQAFEREFAVTWPSIYDKSGKAIASLAGVVPIRAVPTTVILDREGKVAARVLGQVDKTTLNAMLDEVLAEESAAS